jgi:hypothetical protein
MTRFKQLLVSAVLLAMPLSGARLLHANAGQKGGNDEGGAPAPAPGADERDRASVYGNPDKTTDPLNPSNKGLNPRVVDAEGKRRSFPLKAADAPLYLGTGQPMRTPQGAIVRVRDDSVRLNYGMRLERDGRTYFMAWQTNHDAPQGDITKNATGWVAADDLTEEGAAAAKAAIPRRLGNVERPIARDATGKPRTFTINGASQQAKTAAALDLKYIGVTGGHHNRVINFCNLHDGQAGLQMLMNLPDMPGGGIAADCFPNGTPFTAAADEHNHLITKPIQVHDQHGTWHTLTFIYGKAGDTWGWLVKDWLDDGPQAGR